ncbi:MAG TPA: sulfotransferase [Gammaproteobacteria bacterium]|nr:sulfotransferase [Gammaproteobacteria bacterium]
MNSPVIDNPSNDAGRLRDAGLPFNTIAEAMQYALALHKQDEHEKIAQAEQIYRRVLVADPENPEALHFLGLVAHQFKQSDAGIDLMRRSIELRPDSALFHRNLAGVLRERKSYPEAVEAYRRALELQPDYPEVQTKLAELHAELGDTEAAAACYREMLAYHPQSANLHHQAAMGFIELGDQDAARECTEKALELNCRFADAYNTLGIVLSNRGEFDAAAEQYRKAIAINPRNCQPHFNLTTVRRMARDDAELQALEKLHDNIAKLSRDDAVLLEFALGKAYEDIGEYDRAFERFTAGNRLKRESMPYSSERQAAFFEDMCRVFDAGMFERHSEAGSDSTVPIFILGLSRSGTTLIEQIIASHPQVHGAGEVKALYQSIDVLTQGVVEDVDVPGQLERLDDAQLRQIGDDYLRRLQALAPDSPHITDKLPGNVVMTGLIHTLFPRAPLIFVRRDPIDTCVSCFNRLFTVGHHFSYDLADMGTFYVMYDKLMRHWLEVLPEGRALEVRYEDVVEDFETQARRIIEYCGLPWDDACLRFHENSSRVRTASLYQVRQPIYKSSVERWRRYEKHLGPLLEALAPVLKDKPSSSIAT